MGVPFYTQDEIDAAIAKERQWIAAFLRSEPWRATSVRQYQQGLEAADRIAVGAYPRPLVVDGGR